MSHWANDASFYHIYPLGLTDAPRHNDFASPAVPRLDALYGWLDHLQYLGVNALYLGPLFEATSHGYNTVDYYHVDRRLGNNDTLAALSDELHRRGIRLILDAVFNHVGRDFWAFHDVRTHGQASAYTGWFHNLRFDQQSAYGDPFNYEGWAGHQSLVKLNLHNPDVRQHLLDAVDMWIDRFNIDGLRLDAADVIDHDFLRALASHCKARRPDFWLVGEVVHGDYRAWANPAMLDSVTNYESYKGLWSSLEDANYFEIAYALNRQFGEGGVYRDVPLYNFVDNHDVDRVASNLSNSAHLFPLYGLLYTMPGVPALYYGSEWGLTGQRTPTDDTMLRPALNLHALIGENPQPTLPDAIRRLARVRAGSPALRRGNYRQLHLTHKQFAFARQLNGETMIVALNAAADPVPVEIRIPARDGAVLVDVLNDGERFTVRSGRVRLDPLWPHWARILRVEA